MRTFVTERYHVVMTPDHAYGCKRRVFDSDWLKSINRPNFTLITLLLKGLERDGVILGKSNVKPSKLEKSDTLMKILTFMPKSLC